jgi:hypothetical protein
MHPESGRSSYAVDKVMRMPTRLSYINSQLSFWAPIQDRPSLRSCISAVFACHRKDSPCVPYLSPEAPSSTDSCHQGLHPAWFCVCRSYRRILGGWLHAGRTAYPHGQRQEGPVAAPGLVDGGALLNHYWQPAKDVAYLEQDMREGLMSLRRPTRIAYTALAHGVLCALGSQHTRLCNLMLICAARHGPNT